MRARRQLLGLLGGESLNQRNLSQIRPRMGSATSQPGSKPHLSGLRTPRFPTRGGRHSSGRDSVAFEAARPPFATLILTVRIAGRAATLRANSMDESSRRQHQDHESTERNEGLAGE